MRKRKLNYSIIKKLALPLILSSSMNVVWIWLVKWVVHCDCGLCLQNFAEILLVWLCLWSVCRISGRITCLKTAITFTVLFGNTSGTENAYFTFRGCVMERLWLGWMHSGTKTQGISHNSHSKFALIRAKNPQLFQYPTHLTVCFLCKAQTLPWPTLTHLGQTLNSDAHFNYCTLCTCHFAMWAM